MSAPDGWIPDPRPVPPELTPEFTAEPFTGDPPHLHDHITGWASFLELIGPDGVKALAKAVQ